MAVMVGQWQKVLITTIQVNMLLSPTETWRRQYKFT